MFKFYIIVGCNGVGKMIVLYMVLFEILECCEFVNVDEIVKGFFFFNFLSVVIEVG